MIQKLDASAGDENKNTKFFYAFLHKINKLFAFNFAAVTPVSLLAENYISLRFTTCSQMHT